MDPDVRYCTTADNIRIAYYTEGSGPPLLMCPWLIESFAQDRLMPGQREFLDLLTRTWTVTRFDHRGTGLSERDIREFSLEKSVKDMEAVVESMKWKRFALWGPGGSGPAAIAFAAEHPDRVTHLILYGTMLRTADVIPLSAVESIVALARADWSRAAQLIADLGGRPTDRESASGAESSRAWGRALELSCDGETAARLFSQTYESMDATIAATRVKSPTIVLHRQNAPGFAFEGGRRVAATIPGASFVPLRGSAAHFALGDRAAIVRAVARFCGNDAPASAAPSNEARETTGVAGRGDDDQPRQGAFQSRTRVILFADIADSTGLTERLGDTAFRAKARELDRALRERVRANGGSPIDAKTLGDGILATFPGATQAITAALSLESAASGLELSLHVGLHAGDVISEENNVFGGAVNIASRVSALSAPGEVLVSLTVRDLARTSAGVTFEDRGEQRLKGVGEPVRIFAVAATRR
jgi:class 3 adenylate cyclase/pimeloyl-ACP methyl ester carboxylesterase